MKKIFIIICSLLISLSAFSQSVFTFDLHKDALLGVVSAAVFASPFFVENIPASVPTNLNTNDINAFDRSLMFPYHETLDKISDYGVYGLLVLPIISMAGNYKNPNTWLTYGVMYAEAFALTFGTKDLLKNAIIRYRPYMYSGGVPEGLMDDYYNSFPSGSTALAFLSAGFLSATFSAEYPDSPWKIPVIAGAYALAAGAASARIISGSHFLTDVLTGAAIGSIYGWIIPLLHKNKNAGDNVSLNLTGNGFVVGMKF
ncbi:MAG: phosphatase PAP2 family protein [Treponema sp.]|jgi:undecaprenyl-diphosphatase|nr:phosphatase PAP2 family protein [Treponema sp.]